MACNESQSFLIISHKHGLKYYSSSFITARSIQDDIGEHQDNLFINANVEGYDLPSLNRDNSIVILDDKILLQDIFSEALALSSRHPNSNLFIQVASS